MNPKCYSTDEENFELEFSYVIDELSGEYESLIGLSYWVADAVEFTNADVIHTYEVDSLLENLDERASDQLGEVFDNDYSTTSPEAKQELLTFLLQWAEKHVNLSRYYLVKNTKELKITQEDLD